VLLLSRDKSRIASEQQKNKNTDDRYGGKTIEKTMLRGLRACMFSHSLAPKRPFAPEYCIEWMERTVCRSKRFATREGELALRPIAVVAFHYS